MNSMNKYFLRPCVSVSTWFCSVLRVSAKCSVLSCSIYQGSKCKQICSEERPILVSRAYSQGGLKPSSAVWSRVTPMEEYNTSWGCTGNILNCFTRFPGKSDPFQQRCPPRAPSCWKYNLLLCNTSYVCIGRKRHSCICNTPGLSIGVCHQCYSLLLLPFLKIHVSRAQFNNCGHVSPKETLLTHPVWCLRWRWRRIGILLCWSFALWWFMSGVELHKGKVPGNILGGESPWGCISACTTQRCSQGVPVSGTVPPTAEDRLDLHWCCVLQCSIFPLYTKIAALHS